MRKTILVILWLLVPVLLLAYHYGPGQDQLAQDSAARAMLHARAFEQDENWGAAMDAWNDALALLPEELVETRAQIRLAHAGARMQSGELPEAMDDLETLLNETDGRVSGPLTDNIRNTLATANYYAGWLMRLEGAPTEEWMLPVENARMHFRMLAEAKPKPSDPSSGEVYQKNLEAAIRLARMDLSELEGLPLPKFCQGCKNVSQKCRSQRQAKCENPGEGEPKEKKDARSAGFNDIPKGGS
jgi:hypothetical protein